MKREQRGAILVMTLLIVAVVSTLAVNFASAFQLTLARAENRWHGSQARAYLMGAEELALSVLSEDRESNDFDHLGEDWAQEIPPFPVEGGWLAARVEDAQGRFNINNVSGRVAGNENGQAVGAARFTEAQRRMIRLLQTLGEEPLTEEESVALVEAIIDWLDSDDTVMGFGGAESDYYNSLDEPYAAANQNMVSVTELRLVRHMTPALYESLEPLLVALPEKVAININTAQSSLLRALNVADSLSPQSLEDTERWVAARGAEGFETVQNFVDTDSVQDTLPEGLNLPTEELSVSSEYFILWSEAQVARQRRQMNSVVNRTEETTSIIRRSDG